MKLTILFLLISIAAFTQVTASNKPDESKQLKPIGLNQGTSSSNIQGPSIKASGSSTVIQFSAFEKGEMTDFETVQKQLVKIFRSQDSLKGLFLQKFLVRNGVDLTRLSQHPDSLSITDHDIKYILKPKR